MNYTGSLGPNNLTDFTLCMRIKVNFLRGEATFPLSYSTDISDNGIQVRFEYDPNDLLAPMIFKMCKYPDVHQECATTTLPPKIHQKWHHYCLTIESHNVSKTETLSTMMLYLDGTLENESKYKIIQSVTIQ